MIQIEVYLRPNIAEFYPVALGTSSLLVLSVKLARLALKCRNQPPLFLIIIKQYEVKFTDIVYLQRETKVVLGGQLHVESRPY